MLQTFTFIYLLTISFFQLTIAFLIKSIATQIFWVEVGGKKHARTENKLVNLLKIQLPLITITFLPKGQRVAISKSDEKYIALFSQGT